MAQQFLNVTNWGTEQIHIEGPCIEMRPIELHLKEDGMVGGAPSLAIVMERGPMKVVGQISVECLNDCLKELGYVIVAF